MTQGSHKFVTTDRCVENFDSKWKLSLFSLPAIAALPAILAYEIEYFLSLRLQLSLRQRDAD